MSASTYSITNELSYRNYLRSTFVRLGGGFFLVTGLLIIIQLVMGPTLTPVAPAIAIGVLIIIFYPLRGVVIAKRAKLKEIRFVFTADNFLIEAPGNSKVEISKTVIKKVVFKSGYVMLHTRTGKQPIFVGKTQASELKMFLQGNGYRVV